MRRLHVLVSSGAWAVALGCALDGRAVDLAPDSGLGQGGTGAEGQAGSIENPRGSGGEPPELGGGGRGGVLGQSGSSGLTGGAGGAAGAGGNPGLPLPACADQFLAEPGNVLTETVGAPGRFSLSCGPGVSDDVGVFWVAPVAAYYEIDTFGSTFDTALGLVAPACDGTELACNDDGGTPPQSEIVREFGAGEGVVIVVDGKSGTFGDVVLNVNRVTCPGIDLNLQAVPIASTTLDGTDAHDGACGGANQREKAFRWEAPSAGLYRFSVASDEMTPALYVVQGPRCGGELLGCNTAGFQSSASVVRHLQQGEVVSLIVEGTNRAGAFDLNVEDLSTLAACPTEAPLDFANEPVVATLAPGDPSVLTASCAVAELVAQPGGRFPLPERSYPLTTGGGFQCSVYVTTDAPVAVYVLEGLQCGGRELVCQRITNVGTEERIALDFGDLFSGGSFDYVVVVESTDPLSGPVSYTLYEECLII